MVFYEKGIILVDQRIGTFVLPYADLARIVFHTAEDQWLEIALGDEGKEHLMPANMLCEGVIYLKINNTIVNDKYKALRTLKEQGIIPESVKIERSFEQNPYL